MKIEAQYRNFKLWLTLTKHPKHKLSQVVYNDMKSRMNKELWSQKIKRVLDQIGLGYLWTKAHENDIGILNIIKQRLKDIKLQRRPCSSVNKIQPDKVNMLYHLRLSGNFLGSEIWHGIFWGLIFGPRIFLGFDFCPHSIIPVT